MKWKVHERNRCRICGSSELRRFIHFSDMPFTDEFVAPANGGQEFRFDIKVFFCTGCGTAQTLHDVEVTEYYRDYRYTVSTSQIARQFMQRLAQATFDRFKMSPGDRVIEIGSGDGFQLACYQQLGARVLGFEPSSDLTAMSRRAGVDVAQCLFSAETIPQIPSQMRPAQVVLLTYTFDHLPDPMSLLEAIKPVLDPQRGVLLIEVHDVDKIISRCETCLLEHEHTIYLHRASMNRLLERAGYRLLTSTLLPESQRRANSLLIAAGLPTCRHQADNDQDALADLAAEWGTYEKFSSRVAAAYERMRSHVRTAVAAGKRIAGYGAGGRGVMTLAMAGLGPADICFLCDKNTSFHGLLTPATHIPVVSPEHILTERPDEVIVFSFGYIEEIRRELKTYEEQGGRFISLLELLA